MALVSVSAVRHNVVASEGDQRGSTPDNKQHRVTEHVGRPNSHGTQRDHWAVWALQLGSLGAQRDYWPPEFLQIGLNAPRVTGHDNRLLVDVEVCAYSRTDRLRGLLLDLLLDPAHERVRVATSWVVTEPHVCWAR